MTHTGVGTTQKYRCAYIRTLCTYIIAIGPPPSLHLIVQCNANARKRSVYVEASASAFQEVSSNVFNAGMRCIEIPFGLIDLFFSETNFWSKL
jgi:hypothetical protein